MSALNHLCAPSATSQKARQAPPSATSTRRSDGRQDFGQENLGLFRELKLLFAALGAGNSVVPLGDNTRTARMLAEYAASLRR
jgi:hypothetical protein